MRSRGMSVYTVITGLSLRTFLRFEFICTTGHGQSVYLWGMWIGLWVRLLMKLWTNEQPVDKMRTMLGVCPVWE